LGVLLAAVALTLTWGAALDPAETVAGLHGTLDSVALQIRLPGAGLAVALGILVAVASLVWGLREQATLLVGSWAALLATSLAVYLVLPGIMRSGRASAADPLDPGLQGERRRLEQLAFGTEWLEERGPPGFTTPEAAVGALPVWDAERVAGVARRAHLLGPTGTVAAAAPDRWPRARRAGIARTAWWRRTALAWVLQSPELTRAETDGLVLLWRRDVAERLGRLAPFARFDVPVPLVADGALWWIAYGY